PATTTTPPHTEPGTHLRLRLPLRPPFDGAGLLDFLAARAVTGVEAVDDGSYRRTLRLPHGAGSVRLRPPVQHGGGSSATSGVPHVDCALWLSDVRDLSGAVARVRRLFDLDADPGAVLDCLGA
ncbi:AlkA N-terminal domain-containing protein, partial [Saccharomonospora iraqiensis]|uniref:AlkA N-terminal domain-containing protein n=1 Tax=Saccharomonospora iraqiensis TaxID=52698 RepID=UPI000593F092